jgi:hypothetical protein
MSRDIRNVLVALVAVFAAPALAAQSSQGVGPRAEFARAGVSAAAPIPLIALPSGAEAPLATAPAFATPAPATVPAALPQNPNLRRRGVPQMIIGGVVILGGALVGGDAGTIVSLAGLGYGIYGLYLYLN